MRTREVSHKDETIKSLSCRTNNNRPYGLKAPSLCLPMAGIRAARGSTAEQHQNTEDEQAAWLSTEDLGLAAEDKLHSTRWREPRLAALVWNWAVQTPRSFLHALPAYLNSGSPPVNLSPEQAEPTQISKWEESWRYDTHIRNEEFCSDWIPLWSNQVLGDLFTTAYLLHFVTISFK